MRAARAPLQRALERTGDDTLLGAVEASLAYVEAETGDREAALALCRSALARPGLAPDVRGRVLSQQAVLVLLSGRPAEAVRRLDAAVAALADDRRQLGRAHLNRGTAQLQLNAVHAARDDFDRAVALLADDLPEEAAMAAHNSGYAQLLAGDLAAALADMATARPVLAAQSPVNAAVCDQDRAEVLLAAGLLDEGRAALAEAAEAYGRARLRRPRAVAELTLARSLLVDEPGAAAPVARRAARRFERDGATAWRVRAEAVAVQADLARGRRGPALLTRAAGLVAELRAEGLAHEAAALRLALASSYAEAGREPEARRLLSRRDLAPEAPLAVRLRAREVRARLAPPRQAFDHLAAGLAELHTWQSSFGSLDLQTNVVGHGVRLGVRGLALAVASGSPAVLFEWSERARVLASRVQPVRAPQDPQTAADLAELRAAPTPEREAELRRQVRERAWQHRGSGAVTDPVGLRDLQQQLGPNTSLLAHVVTADRVVALVVTERAAVCRDLGPREALDPLLSGLLADLDVAASSLPPALAASVRAGLSARLAALDELLVAPVREELGERCVLTPSGVLAGVPWSLLSTLRGRPVTVAQSATSWLLRRAAPLRVGSAGFVAGPRVPRAEAEVRAAAAEWGGAPVLVGAEATAAAVSDLAARCDVLHVAAHGRHTAENPLFSGLELADGAWHGYDVDQLPAVPDVVLLSACELGRSSVRWGEELIGLTAAWLHAGARCVVASPAAVADDVAHDVLVALHRGLVAGLDPAAALAGALDGHDAGFTCFG